MISETAKSSFLMILCSIVRSPVVESLRRCRNSIWHFLKSSTSCGFHFFHCFQISLFSDLMPFSRTPPNHSTFFCGAPFYRISLLFSMDVSISSLGFSSSTGNTDFHATLYPRATGARALSFLHARTRPRHASNRPRPFLSIGEISIFILQTTPEQRAPAHCLSCTRARDRDARQIGSAPFYRSEKYRFSCLTVPPSKERPRTASPARAHATATRVK